MAESPRGTSKPDSRRLKAPELTRTDKVEATARAVGAAAIGSVVPVVGDVVSTLFGELFPSSYQRRYSQWRAEVTDSLHELAARSIDIDALKDDETFVDLVVDATTIAIRTSSAVKRQSLQNAILNAGLPSSPSAAKQRLFLRLIDDLDELHLMMLSFFESPGAFLRARGDTLPEHDGPTGLAYDPADSNASLQRVLDRAFPDYAGQEDLLRLVISEAKRRGLIESEELLVPCHERSRFTTGLGREFLGFVRAPR